MNHNNDWRFLGREVAIILRALFHSLVTAPAVVLFAVVMLFALHGSLTGQFISEARSFTGDTPEGMVTVCQDAKKSPLDCTKVQVDANEYAAQSDKTLLHCWAFISFMALIGWIAKWVSSDSPSNLKSFISRKRNKISLCKNIK